MKTMRALGLLLILPSLLHAEEPAPKPAVIATAPHVGYFARRIAGGRVAVSCPLPPEKEADLWKPEADDVRALQKASLVLLGGAGIEPWIQRVSLPESRVVDTSLPVTDQVEVLPDTIVHSHGAQGAHSHQGKNPHTWLEPALAKKIAGAVRDALAKLDPAGKADFDRNLTQLETDLDALDQSLENLTRSGKMAHILVTHPTWDYVARHYGWRLSRVDLVPDGKLDDHAAGQLKKGLAESPRPTVILWEEAPSAPLAEALQKQGLKNVAYRPGISMDGSLDTFDLIALMKANIAVLEAATK